MPPNSPAVPGAPASIPGIPSSIPGLPSSIPGAPTSINFGDIGLGSVSGGTAGVEWAGILNLQTNMQTYTTALDEHRVLAMDRIAEDMEEWARANAPWEDQSGDARSTLQGSAEHDEDRHVSTATISHGVDYGVWLETRFGGRFAVILPTIMVFAGRLAEYEVSALVETYESGGRAVPSSAVRTNRAGRLIDSRSGRFVKRIVGGLRSRR